VHRKLDGSGFRLTFPTRRIGDTQAHIHHPIRKDLSKLLEAAIFNKVKNVMSRTGSLRSWSRKHSALTHMACCARPIIRWASAAI
jgi:stage V sporulation protein G